MSLYDPAVVRKIRRIGSIEARAHAGWVMRRVGQAIRMERANAHYTMDDVAALTGLSMATLSRIERGTRAARLDQLVRIAAAMDISVFRLIEGADDRECPRCEAGRIAHVLVCADVGFAARLGGATMPAMELDR